ncbi:MAG: hypothetical protein ABR583_14575 [Gaiellaceae bacterium]
MRGVRGVRGDARRVYNAMINVRADDVQATARAVEEAGGLPSAVALTRVGRAGGLVRRSGRHAVDVAQAANQS